MQNIINKIQSGEITNSQLLTELVNYDNKSSDEYNEIVGILESRDKSIAELEHVASKQHEAMLTQRSNEEIYKKNQIDLKKQSIAYQQKNQQLEHQLSVVKKEQKKQREQIKRNKSAMAQRDARIKKLEKQSKQDARGAKLHPLTTIYSKGESVLQVYPQPLELGIDGKQSKQIALLYTNRKGCFVTAFLDNNHEVAFSSFVNQDAEIADRTRALIQKNTMQVPNEVAEFCQTWLYRVNIINKMSLNEMDMACFDGDE